MSKRKKRAARIFKLILLIAALSAAAVYSNRIMKPVITSIMASQSKISCTVAINEAVIDALGDGAINYDTLVSLVRNANGDIVGLSTDAAEVTRVKAVITGAVNARLEQLPRREVKIAVGTLTGVKWLAGRGPKVTLRVTPSSYAQGQLVNRFDEGGINQTRHQILLEFTVKMTAMMPPYSVSSEVVSDVCIAETIIVGAVPDMFADFGTHSGG